MSLQRALQARGSHLPSSNLHYCFVRRVIYLSNWNWNHSSYFSHARAGETNTCKILNMV